jgi:hypothetical protein
MNLRDNLLAMEQRLWSGGATDYRRTLDDDCLVAFSEAAGVTSREVIADQADSGYVRRDGDWKMMFHQQTPLAVEIFDEPA